jgi:hypothetical protein
MAGLPDFLRESWKLDRFISFGDALFVVPSLVEYFCCTDGMGAGAGITGEAG